MNLPNDVWQIVESYLNISDYYHFRLVCKNFSELSIRYHDIYPGLALAEHTNSYFRTADKLKKAWTSCWGSTTVVDSFTIYGRYDVFIMKNGDVTYHYNNKVSKIQNTRDLSTLLKDIPYVYNNFSHDIWQAKKMVLLRHSYIKTMSSNEYLLNFIRRRLSEIDYYQCAPVEYLCWAELLNLDKFNQINKDWYDISSEPYFDGDGDEDEASRKISQEKFECVKRWFDKISTLDFDENEAKKYYNPCPLPDDNWWANVI